MLVRSICHNEKQPNNRLFPLPHPPESEIVHDLTNRHRNKEQTQRRKDQGTNQQEHHSDGISHAQSSVKERDKIIAGQLNTFIA